MLFCHGNVASDNLALVLVSLTNAMSFLILCSVALNSLNALQGLLDSGLVFLTNAMTFLILSNVAFNLLKCLAGAP